jgi:hypothetical protein
VRAVRSDSIQGEGDWIPDAEHVRELAELRRQIIELGEPPSVANGMIGWLVSKAAGERDTTSSKTRAQYRKILARLERLPGPDGSPRIHVL